MSNLIRLALLPFQGNLLFVWVTSFFVVILLFNLLWYLVSLK